VEQLQIDFGITGGCLDRGMAEHRADGLQGEAVAKHLSGGGMAEDMRSRLGRLDAGAVHGPGRNLAHGLVRQALEGSDRGQEDLVVVHRGPVCQVVKDGVADLLGER